MNKIIFYGDSNVYIFNYLQNFGARIVKFKGSPIKGIVNKNENYDRIIREIKKFNPEYIFLIFGVVDMNFYYYYKKYGKNKEENIFDDIKSYIVEYVKIVSELDVKNKYIIGILPSPIKDKYFKITLRGYGILTEEEIEKIPDSDLTMVNRNKRIEEVNNILQDECKKYNINFCNIFPLTTRKYKMKKIFSLGTYSRVNIHHRYEYLFLIFVNTCLKFLIEDKDYNKIVNDLEKEFNDYIKERIYNNIDRSIEENDKLYQKTRFDKDKITKYIDKMKIKMKKTENKT